MWEIDIKNQLFGIFAAVLLGVLLCALYDILRAQRKIFKAGIFTLSFTDILFWLLSAFVTFIYFLIFTNGEIRGYLLLCELSGFFLCRATFSKLFFKLFCLFFKLIKLVLSKTEWLLGLLSLKILKLCEKTLKILKKSAIYLKKLLKSASVLLYTKKDNCTDISEC